MTELQARFVEKFVELGNATQAYRAAGYRGKGADRSAHSLLRNPEVARAIEMRKAELRETAGITKQQILDRLSQIAVTGETDNGGGKVAALREINRMLGHHAPVQVEDVTPGRVALHVHAIPTAGRGNGKPAAGSHPRLGTALTD